MNWKEGFYCQAESDFKTYQILNRNKVAVCHQIHYLQMAFEKISKAHLAPSGNRRPKPDHRVLNKFIDRIKTNSLFCKKLGYTNSQFSAIINQIRPIVDFLESVIPRADQEEVVSAEYPWKNIRTGVVAPCLYDFQEFGHSSCLITTFTRFFERVIHAGL